MNTRSLYEADMVRVPRVKTGSESPAHAKWAVPIATIYFLLTVSPGYVTFLDDEQRFLQAIHGHTLAFFPGYIGFVTLAGLCMRFLDPGVSLQGISAVFGAMAVGTFYLWLVKLRVERTVLVLGVVAFATSVYHLYNSSVGTTYTIEAFAYLSVGLCCFEASENSRNIYWAALLLAVTGAFRPSTPVFLLPLFLYVCFRNRAYKPIAVFGLVSLFWLIPTVMHFGGSRGIVSAGAAQIDDAVLPSTLFSGAQAAASNLLRFGFYLGYGAHLVLATSLRGWRQFDLLWIVPAAAFYALVYVAWPGYLLGLLAALYLVGIRQLALRPRWQAVLVLCTVCVVNGLQFFVARPLSQSVSTVAAVASTYGFQYSKAGIDKRYQMRLRDALARMPRP